jgi:outer membrane protein
MRKFFVRSLMAGAVFLGLSAALVPNCAAEIKVGYVNIAKIFDGYEKTKQYDARLTQVGRQKEQEMEKRVADLEQMRKQLEVLAPDVRESKARELEARADELKRFRTNTMRDLKGERDKMAGEILKEIEAVVQKYAADNGFDLMLDDRSIVFSKPTYDVSDAILNFLNSQYKKTP